MLRVTPLHEIPGTVDPKRLPDLRAAAVTFIERSGDCLILLDCLECLVLHNGAERVERALADLHDDVAVRNGSLVVFADERTANPRLVAWLQREFDPLPWDPRAVPASVAFI